MDRSETPEAPPDVVTEHQDPQGGGARRHVMGARVPDIPQETCDMIISLVRETEAGERRAYYDRHLANLMTVAVIFFRASRHRMPLA